jgi:hypothetical protein
MLKRLICSILLVIAAAAFVPLGTVEAADDGIVKFKSAYAMPETIARMKKDIADKGIKFFDEIDQAKLAADAGITLLPSTSSSSAIRRSARSLSPPIPMPVSIGRCGCSCIKMPRATCGWPTPISPGSKLATASAAATRNSPWPQRLLPPSPRR